MWLAHIKSSKKRIRRTRYLSAPWALSQRDDAAWLFFLGYPRLTSRKARLDPSLLPDAGGDALGRILGGRQSAVGLLLRSDPLAQTGSVRRSARSISTLLISSCLLVATCGSASADFSASESSDDVDGMDIRHVATDVTGGLIKFTASFYDIIRWGRGATTNFFEIDSRGGGRADRFVEIKVGGTRSDATS